MRAAIYARFSSENQSASSIADQVEVCSRYIAKSGWAAVTTYSDTAMSGASRFRPGYQQLRNQGQLRAGRMRVSWERLKAWPSPGCSISKIRFRSWRCRR